MLTSTSAAKICKKAPHYIVMSPINKSNDNNFDFNVKALFFFLLSSEKNRRAPFFFFFLTRLENMRLESREREREREMWKNKNWRVDDRTVKKFEASLLSEED